jgi:hypothetical protein
MKVLGIGDSVMNDRQHREFRALCEAFSECSEPVSAAYDPAVTDADQFHED